MLKPLRKATHVATAVLTIGCCAFASSAVACSCGAGIGSAFTSPAASRLPANAVGIPWYVTKHWLRQPSSEDEFAVDADRFTLDRIVDGQYRQIPLRVDLLEEYETLNSTYLIYLIGPRDGGLRPGATYRATDRLAPVERSRSRDNRQVVVKIDEDALSADTSLTLHVGNAKVEEFDVAAGVSCSVTIRASQATIAARLPTDLRQWEHQLFFRTIVDGVRWDARGSWCSRIEPGRSWDEVAHDRVFAACEDPR